MSITEKRENQKQTRKIVKIKECRNVEEETKGGQSSLGGGLRQTQGPSSESQSHRANEFAHY